MKSEPVSMRQPWRSVGFRLAFYYGLLVMITMITTVSIIYMQTVGVMYQGMTRQVSTASQKLATRFATAGAQGLIQDIERELSDDQNSAVEVFLYLGPQGLKLAGNLEAPSTRMEGAIGGDRRLVLRGGQQVMAYVIERALPDGSQLLVGHDLRDQEAIDSLVTRGIALACAVAMALLIGGLFVFRQELDRSVEVIRRTLTRVAAGALKERIAPLGQDDEFALLGNEINKMLDRIEVLMNGVRHVSDTIAHNLRTPLTRILLRLRTVADQTDLSARHKKSIDAAVLDMEDLTSVFEKLLRIAETEAGAQRIHFQTVALSPVVREVLDFYEAVAEARAAKLVFKPGENALVLGDPDLLAGAIANLIDNALKYAGAGTTGTITDEATHDHVLLTITDTGPGIAAKDLRQLGTRFFRLDRTVSGHGLGLASVAAVVTLHGGRLWFEQASPGLVVRMEFPRHPA